MIESIVLVVGDDPSLLDSIGGLVRPIGGLGLESIADLESVRGYSRWDRVALAVIHLEAGESDEEVVRLLRAISESGRGVATLAIFDHPDDERGRSLLRSGVADYLSMPLDLARLSRLIEALTVRARDASRASIGGARPAAFEPEDEGDPFMEQVRRVAPLDATILLGGETGTGKTRLARRIHELSDRRAEPFVVINCGSMTATQLEIEMFGHARGSLEKPRADRPSKFAEVGRGTLFLDEIDALPMSLQPRLLHAVEERVFEAGVSNATVPIRARLIAASGHDLEQAVDAGQFRSDLYYRLNVIGLNLPPLRERREVIPTLASKFIGEARQAPGRRSIRSPSRPFGSWRSTTGRATSAS